MRYAAGEKLEIIRRSHAGALYVAEKPDMWVRSVTRASATRASMRP
jgi:hypothetical protein